MAVFSRGNLQWLAEEIARLGADDDLLRRFGNLVAAAPQPPRADLRAVLADYESRARLYGEGADCGTIVVRLFAIAESVDEAPRPRARLVSRSLLGPNLPEGEHVAEPSEFHRNVAANLAELGVNYAEHVLIEGHLADFVFESGLIMECHDCWAHGHEDCPKGRESISAGVGRPAGERDWFKFNDYERAAREVLVLWQCEYGYEGIEAVRRILDLPAKE